MDVNLASRPQGEDRNEEAVPMEICHITITAERRSRLPLFPDEAAYLCALERLGAVCQGSLALFALVAEHVHLLSAVGRSTGGRLAQSVSLALRPVVATPIAPSFSTMVASRDHARSLLRYLLLQSEKHGMPGHPALWVGSCLPDLLGARTVEGLSLCARRVLPDYDDAAALAIVGLPGPRLPTPDRRVLRAVGASRLRIAAAAAFGVTPSLAGNGPAVIQARRAVVQIADRVGIRCSETIVALGRSPRTAWRLRRPALAFSELAVVARRVMLEELVAKALASRPLATALAK